MASSLRVAVTGREGQVARSLAERASAHGVDLVLLGRPELDLANAATIDKAISSVAPDVVISAAAYTAVDLAESNKDAAFAVNAAGAGQVARAVARLGIPIVHLSTDYVFDGTKTAPYREDDATGPTGIYGHSKLAGEQEVAANNPDHAILRTAWVYSPFGKNFVRTMLTVAGKQPTLSVVADQIGNPTAAIDIADGALTVARRLAECPGEAGLRGVFHMAGTGRASWAEFAGAIFDLSKQAGGPFAAVKPISTTEYPTPARRPANSQLDCSKLAEAYGVQLPDWRHSLNRDITRLVPREFSR